MTSEDEAEDISIENVNETFRETLGLEIAKRIAWTSIKTVENECQDIVEGLAPSETKRWHTE
jgi:hypothetical protein